jgi:hypothetical protein
MMFLSHWTSEPYVNANTKLLPRRNTLIGVRYCLPDFLPTCVRIANPGIQPAKWIASRLKTFVVNGRRKRMRVVELELMAGPLTHLLLR